MEDRVSLFFLKDSEQREFLLSFLFHFPEYKP